MSPGAGTKMKAIGRAALALKGGADTIIPTKQTNWRKM